MLVYGCMSITSLSATLKLQRRLCRNNFNKLYREGVEDERVQNRIAKVFELDKNELFEEDVKQMLGTSNLNLISSSLRILPK